MTDFDDTPVILTFGRFKGREIETVPTSYLVWLVRTIPRAPIAAHARGELLARGVEWGEDE